MISEAATKLLWDAQQAADRIARITDGRSFETYLSDDVLRWAVERQFIVIGEALGALRRVDPSRRVDDRLVWGVIERDLSTLRSSLAAC
jgi:uncharacterized protein with HEPN domain